MMYYSTTTPYPVRTAAMMRVTAVHAAIWKRVERAVVAWSWEEERGSKRVSRKEPTKVGVVAGR
jgi:hypothetical protein